MVETPGELRRKSRSLYPPWYSRVKLAFWLLVMVTSVIHLLSTGGHSRTVNPVLIQPVRLDNPIAK